MAPSDAAVGLVGVIDPSFPDYSRYGRSTTNQLRHVTVRGGAASRGAAGGALPQTGKLRLVVIPRSKLGAQATQKR